MTTSQDVYEKAYHQYFAVYDELEQRLCNGQWILGDSVSLLDIRFFVALLRWVYVYYYLFKVNKKSIEEYPHLKAFLHRFYLQDGVKDTVSIDGIKKGYYSNMEKLNPTKVVPLGPDFDL
eukprot:TRINITY_DN2978_c0_g1_i1.p1 TRINITY_DN2978_c0_g1~~TRINITY_DN2978_c0_g1_i1.p1  ORF type:complete len:120 (-),score=31.89 TRINITY_DN2978_c0_g1_i1:48-407(-)